MKTTVVCGLLGSGKTTFIRNFVEGTVGKTVVLVNDFGRAGIDGEIFSADGIDSIELPSGCVCCTLKFDLISTIEGILKDHSPAHLVIEPSGIASPSGVLEALDSLSVRPVTVVGLVDATEFIGLHEAQLYGRFFEDQIITSDVILVNKSDLVSEEIREETARLVETLNPRAAVFKTVNARLGEPLLSIDVHTGYRSRHKLTDHFHFDTLSLKLENGTGYVKLRGIFDEMARGEYGDVVRAKALVQTERGPYRFDLSYGRVAEAVFQKEVTDSRLVMIGEGLKKDAVSLRISQG
ncbi:MAG: GTP-binding protein [Candidatus Sulfobium sp.]|jgi:G3E family GTPase